MLIYIVAVYDNGYSSVRASSQNVSISKKAFVLFIYHISIYINATIQ